MSTELLEKAVAGMETATKSLNESRQQMDDANKRVGELLKKSEAIEKGQSEDRGALAKIKDELGGLAQRMQDIATQHTEHVNTSRKFMKQIAENNDGGMDPALRDKPWRACHNGAIFESRQQAVELGMFLMATMRRDNEGKRKARRWLQDHKQDLRYLPQIPKSFVEALGQEWLQSYNQLLAGKIGIQDLGGTTTPGSVLVHPEFVNTLIRNVEEQGMFRQNALIWPMGSDTVHIPKRTGGLAVYWEGEAESGSETDPSFTLLTMTAKKMMMLPQYSSELDEDSAISIANIFMLEMALAVATEEDRIGFNGDGSGGNSPGYAGFVGVLGAAANATDATAIANNVPRLVVGAAGADLTSEITHAKLRAMQGKLPTYARRGAAWYMHRSVLADIKAIETAGGGPVTDFSRGVDRRLMGDRVVEVDQMPVSPSAASTKVLAYGDLRKAWTLGDRRTPEIQTSEHYAFNTDQLTIRLTARVSFLRLQADAMVVYQTGTA